LQGSCFARPLSCAGLIILAEALAAAALPKSKAANKDFEIIDFMIAKVKYVHPVFHGRFTNGALQFTYGPVSFTKIHFFLKISILYS
jgi:hypothetical protein